MKTATILSQIKIPTLLLDENRARKNIKCMAEKAHKQGVRFRPHFKTHQSAQIAEWFRYEGVSAITVSSVSMAGYFAKNGWKDITIAFPLNWCEMDEINRLADHFHVELLVESMESAQFLQEKLRLLCDVWVKIDVGLRRAGIWWQDREKIEELEARILQMDKLVLRGWLTHSGHSYHASSREEILKLYRESIDHLNEVNQWFIDKRHSAYEISVGDTPGCWLSEDLGQVDEIRPGNFVFFDAWQLKLGVCQEEDIAIAVACPVVAKHSDRNEIIIYGGAIHLSKEFILLDGIPCYGLVCLLEENKWTKPQAGCHVIKLSQEHGVIRLSKSIFDVVNVGDVVCVLPIHSCLAADTLSHYLTLTGEHIAMFPWRQG